MSQRTDREEIMARLRQEAENRVSSMFPSLEEIDRLTVSDLQRLLHEIEVRTVELEIQNEELIRAQGQLELSRHRYFQLYHSAPFGYITLNETQGIENLNETAVELLQVDPLGVCGVKFSNFVAPDFLREFDFHFREAMRSEGTVKTELRLRNSSGVRLEVRLSSRLEMTEKPKRPQLFVAILDITELKKAYEALEESHAHLDEKVAQRTRDLKEKNERLKTEIEERIRAEKELKESEARLQGIFESVSDIIIIKDRDLRITHVNPAMEALHGQPAESFMGKRVEDLFPKQVSAQFANCDQRVLEGEVVESERSLKVAGQVRTYLETRVPYKDSHGEVIGVCVVARDITDWKTATSKPKSIEVDFPSQAMQDLLSQARLAAQNDGTILLQGESGSGKDWLAKWIHDHSPRRNRPYFSVNCAALPPELAEAELFGYEPGAFTGAKARKRGMLELAEGGTLLLNEIGELPSTMQAKLLTFLDEMKIMRVGGEKMIKVNARILAASHRELEKEVEEKRFMSPLMYRLNVLTLKLPPLRKRLEDLPVLVRQIYGDLVKKMRPSDAPEIDMISLESLKNYHWPGNVRELRNVIERALMLEDGQILKLRPPAQESGPGANIYTAIEKTDLKEARDRLTEMMCKTALKKCKGNKKKASDMLGISRDALYRYVRRYELED
jgi:PAS domain S-box-containing protein